MKKILSFVLAFVLLFCAFASVSAIKSDITLEQMFYEYCVSVLPEDMQPSEGDKVVIDTYDFIDDIRIFYAYPDWIEPESADLNEEFGICRIKGYQAYYPYDLGIYVNRGNAVYTLREAYDEGIVTEGTVLSLYAMFSKDHIFLFNYDDSSENKYENTICELMGFYDTKPGGNALYTYYETYEYYSPDTTSEATPDYVLIYLTSNMVSPMFTADVLGGYLLEGDSYEHPFVYGYGIYIPKTQEVIDLLAAYRRGIEGIDKVFTEAKIGRLIGDMDKDRILTIKDATEIQKSLAGLSDNFGYINAYRYSENPPLIALSDFDKDCDVTIKDATAIQKHIAGLEY